MSKRTVSLALAVLLLATLTISTAAAETELGVVEISLWDTNPPPDSPHTATEGQTVVLRTGWGACTNGLVRTYLNASNYQVTVNEATLLTPEQVDEFWGPIQPAPYLQKYCKRGQKPYAAEWRYEWDGLSADEYQIRTIVTLDHQLIDGADFDGDGIANRFRRGRYADWELTLTVLED